LAECDTKPISESVCMGTRRAALAGLSALSLLGAAGAPKRRLCALVHTLAPGDNSVMDAMIASMKRAGADNGVDIRTIYCGDPGSVPPVIELLGEAQAAVIVGVFLDMAVPFRKAAPLYPATRFVHLYGDPNKPPVPNIRTVSYDVYTASYLAGVFGALVSENPVLGYIGGAPLPMLNADANAMLAGARTVNPHCSIKAGFVGSFQDPLKALEVADQLFSTGVEYVQSEASASNLGVFQSALRRPNRMVSGGSTADLSQPAVVAIDLCDFGASLYEQVGAALRPAWSGGHYRTTLADPAVDFVISDRFLATRPAALAARIRRARPIVERAKRSIIAGTLPVPFRTNEV
jgi:basic membrane protein A